jgi:hypothetical protein
MAQGAGNNTSSTELWGEIEVDASNAPKGKTPIFHRRVHTIPVPECGQRQKLRCLQKPSLYEEHIPSLSLDSCTDSLPGDHLNRNLVLHSIDLCKYIGEVKALSDEKRSEEETGNKVNPSVGTSILPLPSKHWKSEGPNGRKLPRLPEVGHQITLPRPAANSEEAFALLRQGLVAQCTFTGYEATQTRAMDVLVDVASSFLTKLSTSVHNNTEHIKQRRQLGFQKDAIEQSLRECGLEGRDNLHQYWQMYIVRYASLLNQKALELQQEYQRLIAVCLWNHLRWCSYGLS